MRYTVFATMTILSTVLFSCRLDTTEIPGAVAGIGERILTEDMLREVMPDGLTGADSSAFVEAYIRRWAESELLYAQAQKNLPDVDRIDRLVDSYRRDLFNHEYQKQLLNEKLNGEITEDVARNYYRTHAGQFVLTTPIIKGLFLKVSETAPQIGDLKKWYKTESQAAVGNIEKYTLHNVVNYDYFYDRWVSFEEVMNNIPYPITNVDNFLRTHKQLEVNYEGYWYLLNISDYLPAKATMPFDFARPQIEERLMNQRRQKFLEEINDELYNEAVKERKIKYYGRHYR